MSNRQCFFICASIYDAIAYLISGNAHTAGFMAMLFFLAALLSPRPKP